MKSALNSLQKLLCLGALISHFLLGFIWEPIFKDEQWRSMELFDLTYLLLGGTFVLVVACRMWWRILDDEPYFK